MPVSALSAQLQGGGASPPQGPAAPSLSRPADSIPLPLSAFPCLATPEEERLRPELPSHSVPASQDRRRSLAREPEVEPFWAALAGSLPRGLPSTRRRSLADDTPKSLTAREAAAQDPAAVGAPTAAGRRLRQRLCRGMVAVCLVTGYRGKRHIYERALDLGIRLVILDHQGSWAKELEAEGVIERFQPFDFSGPDMLERCLEAIGRVQEDLGQVDAVVTFFEFAAQPAALLAERLGLPGNPPSAVETAQDKQATRRTMAEAGLPTPAYAEIAGEQDLAAAAGAVGFPAVLKPISGGASQGVVRVDTAEELARAYNRERDQFLAERQKGSAFGQGNQRLEPELRFMLEAYLEGPEVDMDVVLVHGQPTYGNVVDNWPCIEPHFNETGSNCPSLLPQGDQRRLLQLAIAALQCLGFELGVFHVEAKLCPKHGPQLIEINPRLGGGPVRLMNTLVWGVDLVEEHLLASLGIPSHPHLARTPTFYTAEFTVNCPRSGTLGDIRAIEDWEAAEDVEYCRALEAAGAAVTGPADGLPTWLAEARLEGRCVAQVLVKSRLSTEAAVERVKEIQRGLEASVVIE